jgi:hypothetical protein
VSECPILTPFFPVQRKIHAMPEDPLPPWKKSATTKKLTEVSDIRTPEAPLELNLPPNHLPAVVETPQPADPRRQLPIVTVRENEWLYRLKIAGVLWASVEFSCGKSVWCIEDSRDKCLAHVEGILGTAGSANAALRRAREMIRNGSVPAPEVVAATSQNEGEQR